MKEDKKFAENIFGKLFCFRKTSLEQKELKY